MSLGRAAISYPVMTVTSSRAVRAYGHRNNGKESLCHDYD